jgi:hypothetical protein
MIKRLEGPSAALATYETARKKLMRLIDAAPSDQVAQRYLGQLLFELSTAYDTAGHKQDALRTFMDCRDAWWPVFQSGALEERPTVNLATACRAIGELTSADEKGTIAIAAYRQAIEVYAALNRARPESPRIKQALAECQERLAALLQKSSEPSKPDASEK